MCIHRIEVNRIIVQIEKRAPAMLQEFEINPIEHRTGRYGPTVVECRQFTVETNRPQYANVRREVIAGAYGICCLIVKGFHFLVSAYAENGRFPLKADAERTPDIRALESVDKKAHPQRTRIKPAL